VKATSHCAEGPCRRMGRVLSGEPSRLFDGRRHTKLNCTSTNYDGIMGTQPSVHQLLGVVMEYLQYYLSEIAVVLLLALGRLLSLHQKSRCEAESLAGICRSTLRVSIPDCGAGRSSTRQTLSCVRCAGVHCDGRSHFHEDLREMRNNASRPPETVFQMRTGTAEGMTMSLLRDRTTFIGVKGIVI
jgi:hypothetical protein